jgi:MFS family permease
MISLIAVLVALFLPVPTDRVARTIGTQPIISGALGLLTLVVSPALFLVLAITVILIPLGLVGLLIFGIALLFGWIAIGLELGKRMTGMLNTSWAIPVSTGVGTLVITLIASLTLAITGGWFWALCCIGIPLVGLIMMVGLGGVVASKFGAQVYAPNQPRPATPVPPAYGQVPAALASSDLTTEPQPPMAGQPPVVSPSPAPVVPSPSVPSEPPAEADEPVPPQPDKEPPSPPPSSPLPPPADDSGPNP